MEVVGSIQMSESKCRLVSSRGILKSCTYHSAAPQSSTHRVDYEVESEVYPFLKIPTPRHYVCNHALADFASRVLPRLRKPIVLVSGDSDATVPNDCRDAAMSILASPMIVAWFSQNCVETHPKLHQMPIGLDYHTMSREDTSWGPKISPQDQEDMIVRLNKVPFWKRHPKCYGNFHFAMGHRYAQIDRNDALQSIPAESIDYEAAPVERSQTWETMSRYAFIPSPHGNGLDCHRTWEALALGCIAIVRTSKLDPLYAGLPVWIVEEWDEITLEGMQATLQRMRSTSFTMDKLTLRYWVDKSKNGY